jgi:hypothetical protein
MTVLAIYSIADMIATGIPIGAAALKAWKSAASLTNSAREINAIRESLSIAKDRNIAIGEGVIGDDLVREVGISGRTEQYTSGIPGRHFKVEGWANMIQK